MLKRDICDLVVKHTQNVLEEFDTSKLCFSDKFPEIGAGEVEQALIIALVLEELSLEIPVSDFGHLDSIDGFAEKIVSRLGN